MAEQISEISSSPNTLQQPILNLTNPPTSPHLLTIKLNHENYLLWKAQIVPFLKGHNLYQFVDGSQDTIETTNPEISQKTNQALMSVLISSMTENLIGHVLEATTSREIWIILEDLFSSKTQSNLMQTHFKLTTLKKGSDSITDYYQKAKSLRDTLAAVGKILTGQEFITYLLAGLGTDYDSIVTSITTQVTPLSPAQVYSHLLTHESRIIHQQQTLTSSPELSANTTTKQTKPTPNKGRGTYFRSRSNYRGGRYRGRGGRYQQPFSPPHSPRIVCQVCQKPGHSAIQCYNRFNHSY